MSVSDSPTLKTALWRGVRGRCPNCGRGHIFDRFLKVADRCEACGEEFFHHRADDFPAYIVIVIVGHVICASLLFVELTWSFSDVDEMAVFLPLTLFLAIALIQPVKGAVVALQWGPRHARLLRPQGR